MTIKLPVIYLVQFRLFHGSFEGAVVLAFAGTRENENTIMVLKFLVFVSILVLIGEGSDLL